MEIKEIGRKLKELREKHKYSIREVAEKTGMHFTYVSKIEKGQQSSLDKLQKLCDLYNIKLQSLFGEETDLPEELKDLGVEWIALNRKLKDQGLTPEKVEEIVKVVKSLNDKE